MSRSSKGFADFFPTAPSVLQRKRSQVAESRHHLPSPAAGGRSPAYHSFEGSRSSQTRAERVEFPGIGSKNDSGTAPSLAVQEDNECTQGDLLNGVGSASSTSTASSVFSASNQILNNSNQHGSHQPTIWTPLTHVDASPSGEAMDSPRRNHPHSEKTCARLSHGSPSLTVIPDNERLLDSVSKQLCRNYQARPGKGEVKGEKILYDPFFDSKNKNDKTPKQHRKPKYARFGEKVRGQRVIRVQPER